MTPDFLHALEISLGPTGRRRFEVQLKVKKGLAKPAQQVMRIMEVLLIIESLPTCFSAPMDARRRMEALAFEPASPV
jgi:hypothetical protein